MQTEHLISTLNFISPLSAALEQRFIENLREEHHPKKTRLLSVGQVARKLWFINRGAARAFYHNQHDRECTHWFMVQGDIMISVHSFYTQQPSLQNIELLEDSSLLSMSWTQLQNIYADFPEFNFIGRIMTELYYQKSENRELLLRTGTAKERYDALLASYPDILHKASLGQIASYLNITQETLSRIRGKRTVLT